MFLVVGSCRGRGLLVDPRLDMKKDSGYGSQGVIALDTHRVGVGCGKCVQVSAEVHPGPREEEEEEEEVEEREVRGSLRREQLREHYSVY